MAISLLLGAGFSVNKGYPSARKLNGIIAGLKVTDFCVSTGGAVCDFPSGTQQDPFWYSSYFQLKLFLLELIQFYCSTRAFDYEAFYDYLSNALNDEKESENLKAFCEGFRKKHKSETDDVNLMYGTINIYNQLIAKYLVDGEGIKFYEPAHIGGVIYPGYTGFLHCLTQWGDIGKVYIHTLNHDLFFETFKSSDWLKGELADGFEEMGSPYFGELRDQYKVRLSFFAEKYDQRYNLYKLHGSIDQYPFHIQNYGIDNFIKIKKGIAAGDLLKEVVSEDGDKIYIRDWINYHSDFLSGTTSKILRYNEPIYYKVVFDHFRKNLETSDRLIIIGYGCRDTEINQLIIEHAGGRPIFLVDPYPHNDTYAFCERAGGKLIVKNLENLTVTHFNL
ncbi:SIR2 family protein [Mucilaginibacter pocheonensis]|uniref:SIR2-like domain-containing protein n=1 Tax=Mucilaginibacter pocheonensis TaxID=398050 RepID=A0ABU1TCL1_9SPHI|nr:SIR2 family protein [Mucilaginibacter pocheonensis]MDR6942935.1 hypothetical protein [Mucilaginibacter pocheonensis]